MFQVVHELPGRLRLRSPSLWRNPGLAEVLARRLCAMPGVRQVQANPRTGSLLILHDGAPGRAEALRAEFAVAPLPPTRKLPALEAGLERLAATLLERLAERLLVALV